MASQLYFFMYYVYILRSIASPTKIYIGYTKNLQERIKSHNSGKSLFTSKFKPWRLETYIVFNKEQKAIEFEQYLKTASGIAFRNKRLI